MFLRWALVYVLSVLVVLLGGMTVWRECVFAEVCGKGPEHTAVISKLRRDLSLIRAAADLGQNELQSTQRTLAAADLARAETLTTLDVEQRARIAAESSLADARGEAATLRAAVEKERVQVELLRLQITALERDKSAAAPGPATAPRQAYVPAAGPEAGSGEVAAAAPEKVVGRSRRVLPPIATEVVKTDEARAEIVPLVHTPPAPRPSMGVGAPVAAATADVQGAAKTAAVVRPPQKTAPAPAPIEATQTPRRAKQANQGGEWPFFQN